MKFKKKVRVFLDIQAQFKKKKNPNYINNFTAQKL